jgi:hypothetical protein
MVTRLTQYKKDPNNLGRGAGFYYLRGGKRPTSENHTYILPTGQTKVITGPYYSKYSKERDKEYLSDGFQINKIGIPTKIASEFAHISDGNLKNKIRWSAGCVNARVKIKDQVNKNKNKKRML